MTDSGERQSTIERPVVLDCIDQDDGTTRFRFAFEGKPYDLKGPQMSQTEFTGWFSEYAAKTERCAICEEVIIPGVPLTAGHITPGDSGISHFSERCNDTAAGFCGSYNNEGELVSPF